MPRKKLIRTNKYPYHITTRSNNKDWFGLPLEESWQISIACFKYASRFYNVNLHAYVLMNNHYHLLISTPESNIDSYMQCFNKKFSDFLKRKTGCINKKFGGRYKWTIINEQRYLLNVYRYVYQNPVRANIVKRVEDYPYSTLYYILNEKKFIQNIDSLLNFKRCDNLKWLNERFLNKDINTIKRGFHSSLFSIKPQRDSKYIPNLSLPNTQLLSQSAQERGT